MDIESMPKHTHVEPHLLLYEGAWLSFCPLSEVFFTATIILGLAECLLSGAERLQIVCFSEVKSVLDTC